MKKKIIIEGMSCGNCVRHVTDALKEVPGVGGIQVNLREKSAVVEVTGAVTDESLRNAVCEAGYDVAGVSDLKSGPEYGCCG